MTAIIDGTLGITAPSQGGAVTSEYINSVTAFKNRLINGRMRLAQYAASATVVAGTTVPTASTGYPCVDRWFVYCTGANVVAAQVAGSGSTQNRLQITGAASVTAVGVGQRIEQNNSFDLAGSTCTLSADIANSLLTTVTWTAYYATTTADTFGTIGTPTKTQIATGTWTVNSTVTNYQASFAVPAAATTGIEILLTVGAQTSGTWTLSRMQFEKSAVATSYDFRDYGRELQMCQRYFEVIGGTTLGSIYAEIQVPTGGVAIPLCFNFKQTKRAIPFMGVIGAFTTVNTTGSINLTQVDTQTLCAYYAPAAAGRGVWYNNTSSGITASAEIP